MGSLFAFRARGEQICAGSRGRCSYTGRDIKSAHRGMAVPDEHFGALVGDLVKTLEKFQGRPGKRTSC